MLLSYLLMDKKHRKVFLSKEFVVKTLDEERVLEFLKSMEGVLANVFTDTESKLSEISLRLDTTNHLFRWGEYLCGVFLTTIESKRFNTILTETVFEVEGRFGDQLKAEELSESLITDIGGVVMKNFGEVIFSPIDDLSSVNVILENKNDYFVHTGVEGYEIYESRKNGAAMGNFVNSHPTLSFPALDEVISILRTDLLSVGELEERVRLLSVSDLALTLRQLLRLNIVECYVKPKERADLIK